MIRCLIVDDEAPAREGLAWLLRSDPDVSVIGSCANGVEAIDQTNSLDPDIILLDIQMPDIDGFTVLNSIRKPWPYVIFITAHDEFAVKAFEVNAIDYLMKPFSDERFFRALDKAKEQIRAHSAANDQVHKLVRDSIRKHKTFSGLSANIKGDRLIIKVDGTIRLIPFHEIFRIEAYDYYVKIHLASNFYLIRETMKKLEAILPENIFARVHKSHIINIDQIKAIHKRTNGDYEVEMKQECTLKVSRSYRSKLLDRFNV